MSDINFFTNFMNNEALSKRMSKLDIEEDKTDATKGIPKNRQVKFTHGVYGTITSGGYKGYKVEIREYIPKNSSIKVLVNAKPEIIATDDIFYHDISLEGDTICNVLKIERDGNSYKFYVKTLKNDRMIVLQKDIKSYLLGFRINNGKNDVKIEKIEEIPFSEEIAMGDPDTSDTESSIDYGEEPEQLEEQPEQESMLQASYKDIERTGKMFKELKGKKKEDYNLVKNILELNNENESNINIYEVLDDISSILEYIDGKLKGKQINFNIYKSIIDRRLITALLTAYEMISSEDVNFRGLDRYVESLYENDFFKNISDSFLSKHDIFDCKLKKENSEIDNIKSAMRCLDKIIQKQLKKDINLEIGEEVMEEASVLFHPKSTSKLYKKFKTVEELLEKNELFSFTDLISGKGDQKILSGSKVEKCLNVYKDNLKDYIENQDMSKLQKMLYNFIYENFTNIDKLDELKGQVINILSNKFDDFIKTYEDCEKNKEYFNPEVCRENVIISYIADYTSNDKKGKGKMDDFKTLLKYKEFIRLSKDFIVFLKSCYSESKIYKDEKAKEIKEKLESIKRKRDLEYEYDERTKEWVKKRNLVI